jgi:DNA invertase Pin-like site-specific DNA recombinase
MLTVLGGLAEFERELIRGRKRAKERGVRFGRPPKLNAHQRREVLARREAGETLMDIARSYGVSHLTIMRLAASSPRPRRGRRPRNAGATADSGWTLKEPIQRSIVHLLGSAHI